MGGVLFLRWECGGDGSAAMWTWERIGAAEVEVVVVVMSTCMVALGVERVETVEARNEVNSDRRQVC